jgi:hypothetical protein
VATTAGPLIDAPPPEPTALAVAAVAGPEST